MPLADRKLLRPLGVAAIVAGFLLLDLVIPHLLNTLRGEWLVMMLLGCGIGQLNLIATWAALAPGNLVVRLPWAMLLAVFMWFALVIGNRLEYDDLFMFDANAALFLGVLMLVGVIAVQIPLWVARLTFGWRLLSGEADLAASTARADQFAVRHLLLGMLFFSLALGPARLILPKNAEDSFVFVPDLPQIVAVLLVLIVSNFLITVPTIWGAFLPLGRLPGMVALWMLYCVFLSALEYVVLALVAGPGPNDPAIVLFLLNIAQCLTVMLTLLLLRWLGFRLERVSRRGATGAEPAAAEPASAAE